MNTKILIGKAYRALRREYRLTVRELAEFVGLELNSIILLEGGQFNLNSLLKSKILVRLNSFYTENVDPPPDLGLSSSPLSMAYDFYPQGFYKKLKDC